MSMYFKAIALFFCAACLPVTSLHGQALKLPEHSKQVSLFVGDTSGASVTENNADLALIPASVTKLLTTFVALKTLGVDYKFRTGIWHRSIKGNNEVAIVGGGDPVLTAETLYAMIAQIKVRGIQSIDTLILDDSAFVEERERKGTRAYQAGTSALSVNNNSEEIFACRPLTGQTIKSCSSVYQSAGNIRTNFESVIRKVLIQSAVKVNKIIYQSIRDRVSEYSLLYENYSPPLPKILFDLNHFSTNMVAEQVVYAIGEDKGRFSHALGVKRIKEVLKNEGIGQIELTDGSGLSTANRVSAKQVYQIMRIALNDSRIAPEFAASLSVANVSGTLKKRNFPRGVLFRGKTGSLDGVVAIAGYLTTKNNKQLIVVSLQNGVTDQDRAKSWEETFISRLSDGN